MINYEAAKDSIQKVIDNGQTPLLAFVYRNPADAWFNGVQKRNKSSDGHIVPEATFINTHAIAKENFLKLMRDFGDKVQYIIKEVADGKASEITIEELENKPKYTKEQIKEAINAESYARARAILERLQQGDGQTTESRGSKLAPGRTEKRSNEIQRIDTGADRDSGRVSGRQKTGSVTSAETTISKITSAQAGSRERIMAFTDLPDGEYTVNGKNFTKSGNAFTLDDKTLNAREIEKATESPANPLTTAHDNKGVADNITPKNSADNTIPQSAKKSSGDSEKIISQITSAQAGSRERIMAFAELPDGEHTVNGKSFTKSGNAFTLDGKTLNAREIEKAARTTSEKMRKTVEETVSDAEIADTPKAEAAKSEVSDKSDKKETAVPSAEKSVPEKTDESGNRILFSKPGDLQQNIEEVNQKFNDDLDRQIAGTLPKGYIHQLGTPGDILLSTGVPNLPIELSATRLEEKSKQEIHPFDIADLKNLPKELQRPIAVFSYGNPQKAQNIIIEIQSKGKNYLVGLSLNYNRNGLDVNSIRGLFPKDLHEWLTWIQDGKTLYLNKEKVQNLITQQRINLADVSYLDLNSINNIIQNFENPSVSSKNQENFSSDLETPKHTLLSKKLPEIKFAHWNWMN